MRMVISPVRVQRLLVSTNSYSVFHHLKNNQGIGGEDKQLLDSMEQFKQVAAWLVDSQDSDDLDSLGHEELKNQMKEVLGFLANAQVTVDGMDKDAVVEALSFLNKEKTIIKQHGDEL